jgi:hypothetical protein
MEPIHLGHLGTIRIDPSVCETAKAARHLKSKTATLRQFIKANGPGMKLENRALGRTATFLGRHPDADIPGDEWWQVASAPEA